MDLSRLEPNLDLVKGQNIKLFSKREICQKKAIIMINSIWQNCISDWCVVLHFPCHISRVRRIFDDWWGLYSKLNHEISFLCQGEAMNLFRCRKTDPRHISSNLGSFGTLLRDHTNWNAVMLISHHWVNFPKHVCLTICTYFSKYFDKPSADFRPMESNVWKCFSKIY